ncbi:unnamed protein product [Kuraishia capsulata CBS 1993]|uniref:NAD-dependent epimerase/dehydratase domain-containing protein n=1 Tax=Kuraishia capsulata CBS 1993 TaxID=1382522 RepID=W6MGA5_9ASCO|nr:uncharacterized protein KUCA_T00000778001 [Kuraishia capsulata CBS 1993]CDK24811.1 unnamed protein product [Kuraishia capsulata CBS 1993]
MTWDIKKVLVTGGTGFIGAHIVDNLLGLGITVRLATRSMAKAEEFIAQRQKFADRIEPFQIEDFCSSSDQPNPFLEAVKGCDGIIHAASPLSYDVTNAEEELIKPAIRGVKIVLEAAITEPKIKRIVLTSSFASVMDVARGPGPGFTYTGEDWNPLTYEESAKADAVIAYRGSKKFAELEAWNFIKHNKPGFDLVTFCPPMTFGPVVHPVENVESLNLSNRILWDIYAGADPLPVSRVPVWVDVRDLALAHARSLITETVGGRRYVPSSPDKFSYALAAKIMKDSGLGETVTGTIPESDLNPLGYDLDWQSVTRDLGVNFHGFEECVVDSITQFKTIPRESK